MRFSVDRICELAGLGSESGGLLSEAAVPPAPSKPVVVPGSPPATPTKTAAAAPPKPAAGSPAAKLTTPPPKTPVAATAKAPIPPAKPTLEGDDIDDSAMYEIDETELMEALVGMRQQRLEEATVRDAVRDEIKRALSDKSSSWMYGSNKPTASQIGQVSRGGAGIGFGFSRK